MNIISNLNCLVIVYSFHGLVLKYVCVCVCIWEAPWMSSQKTVSYCVVTMLQHLGPFQQAELCPDMARVM